MTRSTRGAFGQELLTRLEEIREIDIETRGRRSGQPRRATVWVVVDGSTPIVRSEYGDAGHWYRNVLAEPSVAIWVDGRRHPAVARRIEDPPGIQRASELLRRKYARSPALARMVDPSIEPMTVELHPPAEPRT